MNKKLNKFTLFMVLISSTVFLLSFIALIFGDKLDQTFNVIGIRIATLIVAFASFVSTSTFSYLVYNHDKTASRINDDANRRAESFRIMQFTSDNYSIVEFKDSMKIYQESDRYTSKYLKKGDCRYHMVLKGIDINHVIENQKNYVFLTLKIPFVLIEGKMISRLIFDKIRFDRGKENYYFMAINADNLAFVLYDETTKKSNAIINLIIKDDSDFFDASKINEFSKIKLHIRITSLLNVELGGIMELYFSNPTELSLGNISDYIINSSNFELVDSPKVIERKENQ